MKVCKKEKATHFPCIVGRSNQRSGLEPGGRSVASCRTIRRRPRAAPPSGETLEASTRAKIQEAIPALLEAHVTELLGRAKSVWRQAVDAPPGYRNG